MIKESDDQEINLKAQFSKHAQDFDDLQNEMAGRDVGRQIRFLGKNAGADSQSSEKRRAERNEALTNLQLMLQSDPAYAALYHETTNQLRETQTFLDQALEQIQQARAEAETKLAETLNRAARLEDGSRVFKDRTGQVRHEDGSKVLDAIAAQIVWNGTEPALEQMQAEKDHLSGLANLEEETRSGQAEIGSMQESMADQENPDSADRIRTFSDRASELEGEIKEGMEAEMGRTAPSTELPEQSVEMASSVEVPKL